MNRSFYFFAIFFTALTLLTGVFNGILFFELRGRTFALPSYAAWLVISSFISFIGSIMLMRYYYYKKYWFSFSAGILCMLASSFYLVVILNMIIVQQQGRFFNASYLIFLATALLYAVSLLFSNARKRSWLKAAGVFMFIAGLVLVSAFTWINYSHNGRTKFELARIGQFASIAANLLFVLFIMNYVRELSSARQTAVNTTRQKVFHGLMALTGMVALVTAIVIGLKLGRESPDYVVKANKVTEYAEALADPFEARLYVTRSGDTVRYRFMKPVDYDPKEKYPLVVCLHHGGTHGTDNIIQIDGSGAAQMLSGYTNRRKYPAFIFVPQCPVLYNWAIIDGPVFETIQSLESAFAVDSKRIYVTGVSGGGFGSWDFICARPAMFAAAIPVCGGGDPSLAPDIINIPVWAFQGEQDNLVPPELSREMIAAIRKAGGHPRYTEFSGEGHNIWNLVSQTPGLLDWLFAQERK